MDISKANHLARELVHHQPEFYIPACDVAETREKVKEAIRDLVETAEVMHDANIDTAISTNESRYCVLELLREIMHEAAVQVVDETYKGIYREHRKQAAHWVEYSLTTPGLCENLVTSGLCQLFAKYSTSWAERHYDDVGLTVSQAMYHLDNVPEEHIEEVNNVVQEITSVAEYGHKDM